MNSFIRKVLGWGLFALSYISLLLIAAVPFLNIANAEKVATAGSLYLFSHITWWLCVPLLGKDFVNWGRKLWRLLVQKIKSFIGKDAL